jgi:Xaa-Pro aminopeptidase
VLDPVLYVEHAGERIVVLPAVEALRVDDPSGTLRVRTAEELGLLELVAEGVPRDEIETRFVVVACRALGVRVAAVPADLPLGIAEALRRGGVELHVDDRRFRARRRVKTPAQLAGIRRAQAAAEAGMAAAATLLREARPDDSGVLVVDGEPLTCERLQTLLRLVAVERGAGGRGRDLLPRPADRHRASRGQRSDPCRGAGHHRRLAAGRPAAAVTPT